MCLNKGKVTHGNDTDESIVTWGYRSDKDEITGTDRVKSLKNGLGKNKLVSMDEICTQLYIVFLFIHKGDTLHPIFNTYDKHTNFVTVDNCSLSYFCLDLKSNMFLYFCELNFWQM